MKKVAVIILSWNARKHLPDCLKSVKNQTYKGDHYQVVVVDNDSQDGSPEWIEKHYPEFVLIKNKINLGYAAGNNVGIKWALKNDFDYVVVLNDDMRVADDWLEKLVKVADEHSNCGIVQSKILFMKEEYRVNTIGNPLHPLAFSWSGGYKKLSSDFQKDLSIPIASGACLLIKKEILGKVGFLDEKMFMYHEDVDFSWRTRLAGYNIIMAVDSKVYHDHHFSIGGKKFYYSERNRLLCYFSNYSAWTLIVFAPAFILTEIAMLIYSLSLNWGVYKVKSYFSLITFVPHILRKRKSLKKVRQMSDKQMIRFMDYKLDFDDVNNFLIKYVYNTFSIIYFKITQLIIL